MGQSPLGSLVLSHKLHPARSRLHIAPAGVEYPLRVAIRLRAALKNQIRRRLKGMAVEAGRHRPVERIFGILLRSEERRVGKECRL